MGPDLSSIMRLWIAEDEDELRVTLGEALGGGRRETRQFPDGEAVLGALERGDSFDILIADLVMPGADGLQVLKASKGCNPEGIVILMTAYASLDTAIEAIRGGAYEYIRKPFKLAELEVIVRNASEKIILLRENRSLLVKLREAMEEMKKAGRRNTQVPESRNPPAAPLERRILEMDLLLRQMAPPDYDFRRQSGRHRLFRELESLIRFRKEGFLGEGEFNALKKSLLQPFLE